MPRRKYTQARKRHGVAKRQLVAYHEAGHAVVAAVLRVKTRSTTIIPTNEYDGVYKHNHLFRKMELETSNSDRTRLKVERKIMVCLAGPLAQRRWRKSVLGRRSPTRQERLCALEGLR